MIPVIYFEILFELSIDNITHRIMTNVRVGNISGSGGFTNYLMSPKFMVG